MYKNILQGGGSQYTGGASSQVRTTPAPRVPPSQQLHHQQKPQFFQETVRPSEVFRGAKGDEEGINKYRAESAHKTEDLNTDDEEAKFLAKYQVTRITPGVIGIPKPEKPQPAYKYQQQQQHFGAREPPSQALRGNPHHQASGGGTWGARYGNNSNPNPQPYHVQPSYNIVQESTIRPSIAKQGGDDLDKYRLKFEAQIRNAPASSDQPVQLLINGQVALNSPGQNGIVSSNVETSISNDATFTLRVPSVCLDVTRDLKIDQGRYVRFSFEDGQLKFMQSKLDFDD